MAFQHVYDMEQADKLWEAGLLWRRWLNHAGMEVREWGLDTTYSGADEEARAMYSPSGYGNNKPTGFSEYIQYAILLED